MNRGTLRAVTNVLCAIAEALRHGHFRFAYSIAAGAFRRIRKPTRVVFREGGIVPRTSLDQFVTVTLTGVELEPLTQAQITEWRLRAGITRAIPLPLDIHYREHEAQISNTMQNEAKCRDIALANYNYDELLRSHYLRGTHHPDDQRMPLDKWEETP